MPPSGSTRVQAQDVLARHTGHDHHHIEDVLRARGPMHYVTLASGLRIAVITAGQELTCELLADSRLSKDSSRLAGLIEAQLGPTEVTAMHGPSMLMSDPPRHTRLRKLVVREFTVNRVRALRPRVERITADLLDAIPSGEPADLIRAVAFPLPITVICELLGVPAGDHEQLRSWTARLMQDDPTVTGPANEQMTSYLRQLIDAKRVARDDTDLLDALCREDTGDGLTDDELMAMVMLLIVAGHETTTNLIGNALYALLTEPQLWRAVAERPALVAAAIDETLRWDPPVRHATHRVSTATINLGGGELPPGEIVLINMGAAGRDPSSAATANAFDLYRPTGQHVTFGHGIHFCPGALLARQEAEICLRQITSRWPSAVLVDTAPARTGSAIMNGLEQLTVSLQA